MKLCSHILDSMFEQSLFSDLSLTFDQVTSSTTMRFDVHKAIISQSPFFRLLLDNVDRITPIKSTHTNSSSQQQQRNISIDYKLHLAINLVDAMEQYGFTVTPFQQSLLRQARTVKTDNNCNNSEGSQYIHSSHIRFALKWMYSMDRPLLAKTLSDKDILPVLCVAILFGLVDLVTNCLELYTSHQLSIDTIVRDLEIIRQLPRKHKAYLRLRNSTLLMLLRYGPQHPQHIAQLPVDYMSDVLRADSLYIECEFERYRLLREVLMAIMQSLGKLTLTRPLDRQSTPIEYKSGFKRKYISSDELAGHDGDNTSRAVKQKQRRLSRLGFSSHIPFDQLLVDSSPGGDIDKATILSYLLQTTVNYSNMSFDQLSTVRQDGVVDEDIVFKALWQREALERQLFPLNYQHNQSSFSSQSTLHSTTQIRTQPLDIEKDSNRQPSRLNYHKSTANNHTLLDPPRFRFKASVCLALPHDNNHDGWDKVELTDKTILSVPSTTFMRHVTTDPSHNSLCHDDGDNYDSSDNGGDKLAIKQSSALRNEVRSSSLRQPNGLNGSTTVQENVDISSYDTNDNRNNIRGTICNKIIYTKAEYILDHWHRVRLEAQVLPRSLLQIQDEDDRTGDDNKTDHKNSNNDSSVLVCRFELQRDYTVDPSQDDLTAPSIDLQSSSNDNQQTTQRQSTTTNNQLVPHQGPDQHQSKIRYAIYCLNKHEGLMKNDQVDPDDWVLVPVTEVTESTDPLVQSTGYVGQVLINTDALGNKNTIDVDMMVALEIIGL